MRTATALVIVLVTLSACHRPPAETDTDTFDTSDTDTSTTAFPPCESGSTFVSWTKDGGATFAPVTQGPSINTYTWSIAIDPLQPQVLTAEHGGTMWRSTDAGCTFTSLGATSATWWDLHSGDDGDVWGHVENGTSAVHIDGDTLQEFDGPGGSLLGMAVNHDTVRVGTDTGGIFEWDGERWFEKPKPGPVTMAYDYAWDPKNVERAVAGLMVDGVMYTNGGEQWLSSAGIPKPSNIFTVAWSPFDPDVVWAEGLDIDEMDAGDPSGGRHVWRSNDGGQSFGVVVDQTPEITLTNGLPMVADPVDPNVVWFEFGTYFQGEGVWLYRYDHATREVTRFHHPEWDEFRALTFSPADPSLMYVSLIDEQVN